MHELTGQCDCGAVKITIPLGPARLTDCPCEFCKRTGVTLAYYPKTTVTVAGETDHDMRGAKRLAFHRCKTCGLITHWAPVTVDWVNAGVNMRNFDAAALQGIPVGPPQ